MKTLVFLIPRSWHRHFPLWLKKILNRWMKQRGDPGENV